MTPCKVLLNSVSHIEIFHFSYSLQLKSMNESGMTSDISDQDLQVEKNGCK